MFRAVGRYLANVAGPAGTLLVLDDLQWAGPDALDLLATLAHTAAGVRIVGAYRDTEVRPADPLGLLLADLAQARRVHHHALGPLPLDYEIHQGAGLPLHAHINGRLYPYSNVAGTLNLPSQLVHNVAALRKALARS